jgi:ligand-binding sensor domain-containing protein/serine phosphatase RsbU (regulator of sigma subunit)
LELKFKRINKTLKYSAIIFLFTLVSFTLRGQVRSFGHQVNFIHYANDQGFYSPNVRNLYQDSKGRIWVCCQDGLWVFDGRTFQKLFAPDVFEDYDVGSVCEDNDGGMWIGSNQGICLYKNKTYTYFDTTGGKMPRRLTWNMYKDADGTIWAGTQTGLFHLDPKKTPHPLIKKYKMPPGSASLVRMVKRRKNGVLIVGTENSYLYLQGDSLVRENTPEVPVYSMVEFENGKEWFSGWGSPVRQFNGKVQDSVIDVGSGVLSLAKDKLGNIWFSTFEKGLFKYDGKQVVNYSTAEGLDFNAFWTSMTDREGNVWFGSFGNGLYKFSGEGITSINAKTGLFNEVIANMKPDTSGNVWMVTENSISSYDTRLNTVTSFTSFNGRPIVSITNLEVTGRNEVLALAYAGNGYKIHNGKITSEPWIGGFAAIKDNNNVLYMCEESGLYKVSADGKKELAKTKRKMPQLSASLMKDNKGRIWAFSVFTGISYYDGNDFYPFNKKNGFMRTPGTCVYGGEHDTVWIGTRGRGLVKCVIVKDSIMKIIDTISISNGLHSDIINSVDIHKGKMYIGTAYGLGVMDMAEYNKGVKRIKLYTADEGLVNSSVGVCFIDKEDKLWLATPKGAYIFDTRSQFLNTTEPNTHITNIQLLYENQDWIKKGFALDSDQLPLDLDLPYNNNHFTFEYIGISHTAPTKVKYQCMLAGMDKDWLPVTNKNEITYSNLSPGSYTFMVKACNNDGIWNTKPATFSFVITPPFWRTPWFMGIMAIGGLLGAFNYVRTREKKLRDEKQMLERKVEDRTVELKHALKEVEEKQKEIIDSINYAKRLQKAILTSESTLSSVFEESFVLFKPKDIVSGDFYWLVHLEDKSIAKNIFVFAAADCTGHGVPGAFMSMLNSTLLNQTVHNPNIKTPADVLNFLNDELPKNLRQPEDNDKIQDGMDIAFGIIDLNKNTFKFCGANNPCWIVRNNELIELKPQKQAITAATEYHKHKFVDQEVDLQKGDTIFAFTDGYADQFGGPKGKKFMYKRLSDLLISINSKSMNDQKDILLKTFSGWKGSLEQVDDVCIIGIKV